MFNGIVVWAAGWLYDMEILYGVANVSSLWQYVIILEQKSTKSHSQRPYDVV